MKTSPTLIAAGVLALLCAIRPVACAQAPVIPAGYDKMVRQGAPSHPTQTLDDAVAALRLRLRQDHKEQYISLITAASVRTAVALSEKTYNGDMGNIGAKLVPTYQKNTALMRQIASGGKWPIGAFMAPYYHLTDENGVTYVGIGVRMIVLDPDHPGEQLIGSSWPILDAWYGRG